MSCFYALKFASLTEKFFSNDEIVLKMTLNPTYLYVYAGLEIALAIHITVCNSFVMWAFYRYRQLRTITNTFIFSLALTDFLTGLLGIPLTVFSVLSEKPASYYGCLAIHSSVLTLCTVSIFHLLVITFDKFLSISCRYIFLYFVLKCTILCYP